MSKALHRRLLKLESRRPGGFDGEAWINRCMVDPVFLVESIRANPAPPGSRMASIQAELLELAYILPLNPFETPKSSMNRVV